MPRIGARTNAQLMIEPTWHSPFLWFGEPCQRIAHRYPWFEKYIARCIVDRRASLGARNTVTFPVRPRSLVTFQSGPGMRRGRKRPASVHVRTKTDDNNSQAMLGNPIIGCVHHRGNHLVTNILVDACGMFARQASRMLAPRLSLTGAKARMLQPKENVVVVVGKRGARKPLDVLYDKSPWAHNGQHICKGGKHIARIKGGPSQTTQGKGLTGRTAG